MRGALIFLCLTLWATANARPQTEDDAHYEGQRARLEDLKEKLAELKEEAQKRSAMASDVDKEMEVLEEIIRQAEPSGCNDRFEFQCGGHHPKCISRLLVCDSYADCENAADENEQCRVYTPAGSTWEGRVESDTCTKRRPKEVRLTIDSYKIFDYLRSFPRVTATLEIDPHSPDFDPTNNVKLEGSMDLMLGDNILYFGAPEQDGLALQCVFDGIDDSHCHGTIVYESSQEPCAFFILHRTDSYEQEE